MNLEHFTSRHCIIFNIVCLRKLACISFVSFHFLDFSTTEGVKTVLLILSQTYVHRVGRTARAGKPGSAITLLEDNQMDHFDGMMTQAGKTASKIHKIRAGEQELQPYFEKYHLAEIFTQLKPIHVRHTPPT